MRKAGGQLHALNFAAVVTPPARLAEQINPAANPGASVRLAPYTYQEDS